MVLLSLQKRRGLTIIISVIVLCLQLASDIYYWPIGNASRHQHDHSLFPTFQMCDASRVVHHLSIQWLIANPDGFPRNVLSVLPCSSSGVPSLPSPQGKHLPGPILEGKLGDEMHIFVHNNMRDETTSLHFHGLHMKYNAWADGVEGVTECGIPPGSVHEYAFNLTQTGTYWYHAHTGVQYGDGLLGALLSHYPNIVDDPIYSRFPYDHRDHTILLQDWFHESARDLVDLLTAPRSSISAFTPKFPWPPPSLLMNGKGGSMKLCGHQSVECTTRSFDWTTMCADRSKRPMPGCYPDRKPLMMGDCVPVGYDDERFSCVAGEYVRFRFINGASFLPLKVSIAMHKMIIVARDGVEVIPKETDFIILGIGQRYDVIVHCNQGAEAALSKKPFDITAQVASSFLPCNLNFYNVNVSSWLTYSYTGGKRDDTLPKSLLPGGSRDGEKKSSPRSESSLPIPSLPTNVHDTVREYYLPPLAESKAVAPAASERIVLIFEDVYSAPLVHSSIKYFSLNKKIFRPLGDSRSFIQEVRRNPDFTKQFGEDSRETYLPFTKRLALGRVYEIAMVSLSHQQHPWHLHGYSVQVVGVAGGGSDGSVIAAGGSVVGGVAGDAFINPNVTAMLQKTKTRDALPVIAEVDSWTVPAYGGVIFRITADNPGPFIMHCHVDWHVPLGMAMVVSVEATDGSGYKGLLPPPPGTRPCGTWASIESCERGLDAVTTGRAMEPEWGVGFQEENNTSPVQSTSSFQTLTQLPPESPFPSSCDILPRWPNHSLIDGCVPLFSELQASRSPICGLPVAMAICAMRGYEIVEYYETQPIPLDAWISEGEHDHGDGFLVERIDGTVCVSNCTVLSVLCCI
tara:strand:+ start:1638 stop:4199 length:2562 start_codon:yes stop_codon:yes gene_type:complete